jgi:hypothetical protein
VYKLSRSSVTASDDLFGVLPAAYGCCLKRDEREPSGLYVCPPRGEILRRWTDGQRRRHSARVLPSIMDVSVGIEDDQMPS